MPASQPFSENMREIADSMGVFFYQRFSMMEASLFLRCSLNDLKKIVKQHKISFIQVTSDQVDFFGFQLLEYLLKSITIKSQTDPSASSPERIVRSKELQNLTGLSRTTIWRLERKGDFPHRAPCVRIVV